MVIDLHCHILPGVDDGAQTMEEALEMARTAVQSGVDTLVATPHYRYYGHDNRVQIVEAFERLQDQLVYEQIPLELLLGTEILLGREHHPPLHPQMTYPHTKWFLAEFAMDEHPHRMNELLQQYAQDGYVPIVAHPERYFAIQEEPILAEKWTQKGWGVQLNRDSLLGGFGADSFYCADIMLKCGWANLIASDAHDTTQRHTDWSEALDLLYDRYDPRLMEECIHKNPLKILQGASL